MNTIKLASAEQLGNLTKTEMAEYVSLISSGNIEEANKLLSPVKPYLKKDTNEQTGYTITPVGGKRLYLSNAQLENFGLYVDAYN